MIKVLQWLTFGVLFLAVWAALLILPTSANLSSLILFLPVFAIIIAGLLSAAKIVYGVFTFNDCPEEEIKLREQISEARKGLLAAGYKF